MINTIYKVCTKNVLIEDEYDMTYSLVLMNCKCKIRNCINCKINIISYGGRVIAEHTDMSILTFAGHLTYAKIKYLRDCVMYIGNCDRSIIQHIYDSEVNLDHIDNLHILYITNTHFQIDESFANMRECCVFFSIRQLTAQITNSTITKSLIGGTVSETDVTLANCVIIYDENESLCDPYDDCEIELIETPMLCNNRKPLGNVQYDNDLQCAKLYKRDPCEYTIIYE